MDAIVSVPKTQPIHVEIVESLGRIFHTYADSEDFEGGFGLICDLEERGRSFDRAKSIGFEILEGAWKPEKHEGESFLAAAVRQTPLNAITIRNHILIQRLLDSGKIPDQHYESIEQAGAKSLIQIAHVNEVHDLEDSDWLAFSEASGDERKVGMIARKIKKVKPRSNYLAITINEKGELVAHTAEAHEPIGKLYVNSESPVVQKGISRLTNCSGVLPVVEY